MYKLSISDEQAKNYFSFTDKQKDLFDKWLWVKCNWYTIYKTIIITK